MSNYQHDRHFTLEEASNMLPWVREQVEKIVEIFEELNNRGFDIVSETWTPKGNGHQGGPPPDEFQTFKELIVELDREGVLIKNFRKGVVDFPHIRANGEEVYLCWMLEEDEIRWWHRIPDGFMGREKL